MKIHLTGDSLMARHEDADIPMVNIKLYDLDPSLKVTNSAISAIARATCWLAMMTS